MKNHLADFNKIQFINGGKGTDTVTLEVKHNTQTHDVVVNGVLCDYCGFKEDKEFAMSIGDLCLCEHCYDHMTE